MFACVVLTLSSSYVCWKLSHWHQSLTKCVMCSISTIFHDWKVSFIDTSISWFYRPLVFIGSQFLWISLKCSLVKVLPHDVCVHNSNWVTFEEVVRCFVQFANHFTWKLSHNRNEDNEHYFCSSHRPSSISHNVVCWASECKQQSAPEVTSSCRVVIMYHHNEADSWLQVSIKNFSVPPKRF